VVDRLPTVAVLRVLVSSKHFDILSHEGRVLASALLYAIYLCGFPFNKSIHRICQVAPMCTHPPSTLLYAIYLYGFPFNKVVSADPQTTRNPFHQSVPPKLKNLDPTRPNPTNGSTQPMDNQKTDSLFCRRPMEGGRPAT